MVEMGLTDSALPVVVAVLALAVFVLVALGWPHPRRRGLRITVRALQALLLNGLVLVLAGVLMNDQYLFYVSWADLLGSGPEQVGHAVTAGDAAAGGRVHLGDALRGTTAAALPALPSPGQREQSYTVTGASSGLTGQVIVLLPQGYDPTRATTYPVIESLSGYPGTPRSNFRGFALDTTFQDLVDRRAIRPPIIVMPQINTPNSLDTECVNAPGRTGLQTETWLAKDVPDWAAQHFHVALQRSSWAVMGFSYGGWCAAMLAMHHPATFGAAMSLMGYFRPEFGPAYDPLTKGVGSYDLAHLARTAPPPVSLWLMASKDDPTAYPQLVAFLKSVRAPMAVTSVVLRSGGHRVDTIPPVLPGMLAWLGSALPGFKA